jgi:2-polyprenyl-3-methyl-5-hydroxy-6-metoxy-1,4-benzoquinol methylase
MPSPPLLSPYLQTRRFQAVKPYLNGDVLDLGCGRAELVDWLEPDQTYFGVEGNEDRTADLRARYPGLDFLTCDLDHGHLDIDRQFDTITMIAVIEHLTNPPNLLEQLPQLLRINGHLVITTPSPLGDRIHQIGAKLGLFSMIAVEDHSQIYSPSSLSALLTRFGFIIDHFQRFLLGGNQLFVCKPIVGQAPPR